MSKTNEIKQVIKNLPYPNSNEILKESYSFTLDKDVQRELKHLRLNNETLSDVVNGILLENAKDDFSGWPKHKCASKVQTTFSIDCRAYHSLKRAARKHGFRSASAFFNEYIKQLINFENEGENKND